MIIFIGCQTTIIQVSVFSTPSGRIGAGIPFTDFSVLPSRVCRCWRILRTGCFPARRSSVHRNTGRPTEHGRRWTGKLGKFGKLVLPHVGIHSRHRFDLRHFLPTEQDVCSRRPRRRRLALVWAAETEKNSLEAFSLRFPFFPIFDS